MKRFFQIVAILILFAVFLFCGWMLAAKLIGVFSNASDTIKAATIASFGSLILFFLGRYFESRREAKQRINSEKIEVYSKFFDFYFDIFTHEKIHGEPTSQQAVLEAMLDFQKDVVFWGSDGVIKAYLDFKDQMASFSENSLEIGNHELPQNLAEMFKSAAAVLVAMRRDVGYWFTSLNAKDVARLQLSTDEETMRIFNHL